MKNRLPLVVWATLVVVVLLAAFSLNREGHNIIGRDFSESNDLAWQLEEFYSTIGPTVLNPIDRVQAKEQLTVSEIEIEEYRYWYGSLPAQISNIHDQYDQRIEEARVAKNETLQKALTKERDIKLADINKNFEDDAHVEAKIRKEKEKALQQYLNEYNNRSYSLPIAYEFTNVETGETFSVGDVSVPSIYKKQFNSAKGYFKAHSLPGQGDARNEWTSSAPHGDSVTISNEDIRAMANTVKSFEGVVSIPKAEIQKGSSLYSQYKTFNRWKYGSYAFWFLGLVSLITLLTVMKFQKAWVIGTPFDEKYANLKIDLKLIALILTGLVLFVYIDSNSYFMDLFKYPRLGRFGSWTVTFLVFGVLPTILLAFQLVHGVERWKHKGAVEADLKDTYFVRFLHALQTMFLKKSIGVQTFILLIGFFLAGVGFLTIFFDPIFLVLYSFCVLFLGLPVSFIFVRRVAYLNKILVATEAMAAGRLNEEIKIEGKSPLAEHAKNLNNLREGVRSSMNEQAKSERLKTELITNVSHDLRTPLTSIITYTDLLKDESITPEERANYVDILDKKSQRLKTLIEDLFEVSKMASGNLELHKQRVDLTQLLQQALAEHADDITQSGLDFRTDIPDDMLMANVDGQRWWRVLDNLIVNAIKYSLPGTRVYVTLRKRVDVAEFVVKNITKYELGENVDELFERFKRADTSRHTDGSGLGLAIAQSIVDMHGGNMKIELDGDLFKVTVTVPMM